ncbi:hypothetical protein D3C80_713260 [compost metagenome]
MKRIETSAAAEASKLVFGLERAILNAVGKSIRDPSEHHHPRIAASRPAVHAVGRILHFHQDRGGDDTAHHLHRIAHADCRSAALRGDPAARAAPAHGFCDVAAVLHSGLYQQRSALHADCLGGAEHRCRSRRHSQCDDADLHLSSHGTRHPARAGQRAQAVWHHRRHDGRVPHHRRRSLKRCGGGDMEPARRADGSFFLCLRGHFQ